MNDQRSRARQKMTDAEITPQFGSRPLDCHVRTHANIISSSSKAAVAAAAAAANRAVEALHRDQAPDAEEEKQRQEENQEHQFIAGA